MERGGLSGDSSDGSAASQVNVLGEAGGGFPCGDGSRYGDFAEAAGDDIGVELGGGCVVGGDVHNGRSGPGKGAGSGVIAPVDRAAAEADCSLRGNGIGNGGDSGSSHSRAEGELAGEFR